MTSPDPDRSSSGSAAGGGYATYVYCIARSATRPAVPRRVTPLPGSGTPRALAVAAGQWAIVGDVPRESFSAAAIEQRLGNLDWVSRCGAAHQAVVDACLRHAAVVPMALFTIFDNDERALAGLRHDRTRLDAALDRVAGRHEWVVRVLRAAPGGPSGRRGDQAGRTAEIGRIGVTPVSLQDAKDDRTTASPGAAPGASLGAASGDASGGPSGGRSEVRSGSVSGGLASTTGAMSGRAFLLAKAHQRQAARRRGQQAENAVRTLAQGLVAIADDVRFRGELEGIGAAALLDAAFLVSAAVEARFKREARRLAAALTAQGYGVTVTGPWPCYSFVAEAARS